MKFTTTIASALAIAAILVSSAARADDGTTARERPIQVAQAGGSGGAVDVLNRNTKPTVRLLMRPLKTYSVYLVNMSGFSVDRVRIGSSRWLEVAGAGKSCDREDFDWCLQNQRWATIALVNCGRSYAVDVEMVDARGNRYGVAQPWQVSASCAADGGAFGLTN